MLSAVEQLSLVVDFDFDDLGKEVPSENIIPDLSESDEPALYDSFVQGIDAINPGGGLDDVMFSCVVIEKCGFVGQLDIDSVILRSLSNGDHILLTHFSGTLG